MSCADAREDAAIAHGMSHTPAATELFPPPKVWTILWNSHTEYTHLVVKSHIVSYLARPVRKVTCKPENCCTRKDLGPGEGRSIYRAIGNRATT
nr:hypothetical protein CFP56_59675 [Quercus suber]